MIANLLFKHLILWRTPYCCRSDFDSLLVKITLFFIVIFSFVAVARLFVAGCVSLWPTVVCGFSSMAHIYLFQATQKLCTLRTRINGSPNKFRKVYFTLLDWSSTTAKLQVPAGTSGIKEDFFWFFYGFSKTGFRNSS